MINAIKIMLLTSIKNLVALLVTDSMIIWALEKATQATDNKIDDNVVQIIRACYRNDERLLKASVETLWIKIKAKKSR